MTSPTIWRVWDLPTEPGPEVQAVRDDAGFGDLWRRDGQQWLHVDDLGKQLRLSWHALFEWAPLVDETPEDSE